MKPAYVLDIEIQSEDVAKANTTAARLKSFLTQLGYSIKGPAPSKVYKGSQRVRVNIRKIRVSGGDHAAIAQRIDGEFIIPSMVNFLFKVSTDGESK